MVWTSSLCKFHIAVCCLWQKKLKINLYINEIPAVCAADNPASNKWLCYCGIWHCSKLSLYSFTHNSLTHANLCKPHVLPHMTAISILSVHLISQVVVVKGRGQAIGWAHWFMSEKLKPGLVESYDTRPGNGEGLLWCWHFINLSLTYLDTYPPTYRCRTQMRQLHQRWWVNDPSGWW